jgi:hypothetical protein
VIIHDFRCVVMALVLSDVSGQMTHLDFRFAVHAYMHSDERYRLPFEAEWLIREIDPRKILKLRDHQVADCRDRLLDLGYFCESRYMGQPGVQIAPDFRRDTADTADPRERVKQRQLQLPLPTVVRANSGVRREQREKSYVPRAGIARGTDDDHDDEGGERLEAWSIDQLEERFSAQGGKLQKEDALWRRRCDEQGWAQDDRGWKQWLIRAIERRPRPRAKPGPVASGNVAAPVQPLSPEEEQRVVLDARRLKEALFEQFRPPQSA